jgi:hypothetical protein
VGADVTNEAGAFDISVASTSLPTWVKDREHGFVNLVLNAVAGDRTLTYAFSRSTDTGGGTWMSPSVTAASTAPESTMLHLDMGAETAWDEADDPSEWTTGADGSTGSTSRQAMRFRGAAVAPTTAAQRRIVGALGRAMDVHGVDRTDSMRRDELAVAEIPQCWQYYEGDDLNNPERFLNLHGVQGIPETATQSATATHTLGVGVYTSGGGWGQSGTQSIARSASGSASTTRNTSYSLYNRVNYRIYRYTCAGTHRKPWNFYDVVTDDGAYVLYVRFTYCGRNAAGDNWDSGSATNITWGNGVDLGPVKVSAQSGYSSSLNVHFHFNRDGYVCGSDREGPLQSSQVGAAVQ